MGMQIHARFYQAKAPLLLPTSLLSPAATTTTPKKRETNFLLKSQLVRTSVQSGRSTSLLESKNPLSFTSINGGNTRRSRTVGGAAASSSSSSDDAAVSPLWESWIPDKACPSLSDILWPSLGAFAAMAMFGKIDQILAPKGMSMTIAPLGAVCAVLFVTPSSPAARKYNMFMAQIGCAAIGVIALTLLGSGWLTRSVALAATIAFMVYTRCIHPPAASLPLLFIDGVKLHRLNYWYAFFPGAAGCLLLCLIQEIVCYLKDNYKF